MKGLRIQLLPVGMGDCILLRFPDHSWAVIDSGGDRVTADMAAGMLQNTPPHGRPVRFILATHHDIDHIGGIPRLLVLCSKPIGAFYYCKVDRELDGGTQHGELDYVRIARQAATSGYVAGAVSPLQAGDVIPVVLDPPHSTMYITVLNPSDGRVKRGPARSSRDRNNASVVLQIEFRGACILLCGDIEEESWGEVIEQPAYRPPHVLKVPHHGSINGKPPLGVLTGAVGARWALLSTPSGSRTKPHPDTCAALLDAGWTVRCTGWSPTSLETDKEHYPVPTPTPLCPKNLWLSLLVHAIPQKLSIGYASKFACCLVNELVISPTGEISHSRPPGSLKGKSCDRRRASGVGTP